MIEDLKQQIDTNKNKIVEDKELLDFLQKPEQVKAVGDHLNKVWMNWSDEIYGVIESFVQQTLGKIKKNEPLTSEERAVWKVKYYAKYKNLPLDDADLNRFIGRGLNQNYQSNMSFPTPAQNPNPFINIPTQNDTLVGKQIELTPQQKELQIATMLKAGEFYAKFLQDKGVCQPLREGDKPHHIMYYEEIQRKLLEGKPIDEEKLPFYCNQIFPDTSGVYKKEVDKALKNIKEILFSKEWWDEKGLKEKEINILREIRQIDKNRGLTYVSWDMLTSTLLPHVLNTGLVAEARTLEVLKPNERGEFINDKVATFYEKLKNPSQDIAITSPTTDEELYEAAWEMEVTAYGDKDIFEIFDLYGLPKRWATDSEKFALQKELVQQVDTVLKQYQEVLQKEKKEIRTSLIEGQTKEVQHNKKEKEQLLAECKQHNVNPNTIDETLYKTFSKELEEKQNIDSSDNDHIRYQKFLEKLEEHHMDPKAFYMRLTLDYFDRQINFSTQLLNGNNIELENMDGSFRSVNLDMVVDNQYQLIENQMIWPVIEKWLLSPILEKYADTANMLKRKKDAGGRLTTNEKTVDMLADITGAGKYVSDKNFNTAVAVSKELAIQVALMAISGGIANIAAKGTILAIKGVANAMKAGKYATRVAKYANLSKHGMMAGLKTAPELLAADIIAEGAVFHLANTTLNAPLQWMDSDQFLKAINPFGSYMDEHGNKVGSYLWYLESMAFMGVMKSFQPLTAQVTKVLEGTTGRNATALMQSHSIKNALAGHTITLPGEVLGMQATSAVVGFTFGHEVDLTPESRVHTIAMVIGLRFAHVWTNPLHKAWEQISDATQKGELTIRIDRVRYGEKGVVKDVEYSILDKEGKVVEIPGETDGDGKITKKPLKGIASQAELQKALAEREGKMREMVVENAQLSDEARLLKAQELLGEKQLTPEQKQAILEAHSQEGTIYNLNQRQIRDRVEILQKAGFKSEEIRVLFENGIVGKSEYLNLMRKAPKRLDMLSQTHYWEEKSLINGEISIEEYIQNSINFYERWDQRYYESSKNPEGNAMIKVLETIFCNNMILYSFTDYSLHYDMRLVRMGIEFLKIDFKNGECENQLLLRELVNFLRKEMNGWADIIGDLLAKTGDIGIARQILKIKDEESRRVLKDALRKGDSTAVYDIITRDVLSRIVQWDARLLGLLTEYQRRWDFEGIALHDLADYIKIYYMNKNGDMQQGRLDFPEKIKTLLKKNPKWWQISVEEAREYYEELLIGDRYDRNYTEDLKELADALLLHVTENGKLKFVNLEILANLTKTHNREANSRNSTFLLAQRYAKAKQFESSTWKEVENIEQMSTVQKKAFLDFIAVTQYPENYLPKNLTKLFILDSGEIKLEKVITQLSQQLKEEVKPLASDRVQEVQQSLEHLLENLSITNSRTLGGDITRALPEVFPAAGFSMEYSTAELLKKVCEKEEFKALSTNDKKILSLAIILHNTHKQVFTTTWENIPQKDLVFKIYVIAQKYGFSKVDSEKIARIAQYADIVKEFSSIWSKWTVEMVGTKGKLYGNQKTDLLNQAAFYLSDGNTFELAKILYSTKSSDVTNINQVNGILGKGVTNKKEATTIMPQTTKEEIIVNAQKKWKIETVTDEMGGEYQVPIVHADDIPNFRALTHTVYNPNTEKSVVSNYFLFDEYFSTPLNDRVISVCYIWNNDKRGTMFGHILLNAPNNKQHHFSGVDIQSVSRETDGLGREFDYTHQLGNLALKTEKITPEWFRFDWTNYMCTYNDVWQKKQYVQAMDKTTQELGDKIMSNSEWEEWLQKYASGLMPQYFTHKYENTHRNIHNEMIVSQPEIVGYFYERIPSKNILLQAGKKWLPIVIFGEKN